MSEKVPSERAGLGSQCEEPGQRKGRELDSRAGWRPNRRIPPSQELEGGGVWCLNHCEASVVTRFHLNRHCMKVNERADNLNGAHEGCSECECELHNRQEPYQAVLKEDLSHPVLLGTHSLNVAAGDRGFPSLLTREIYLRMLCAFLCKPEP